MRELARRVGVLLVLAGLLVAVAAVIVSPGLAERFLFLPDPADPGSPPELDGVAGVVVSLRTSDDVGIRSWWYEAAADAPAVLLLHGNAGHVGDRLPLARGLVSRGVSVLLLEYRGYGGNPGRPTIEGTVRDVRAGLSFLSEAVGDARVVVFGRSVGGALGVEALGDRRVAGLVLEATFTSLASIARNVYRILPAFVFRRLRGHLEVREALAERDEPLLVIHGRRDRIVPPEMGRELYEAAGGEAEWYPVEGAGHNDPYAVAGDPYFDRIVEFVRDVTGTGPGTLGDPAAPGGR